MAKTGDMMKKLDGWQYPLLFLVLMISAGVLYCHTPTAPDAAAWVQAIGSIVAIGIAIWVANRQHREARQQDKDETRAFVQSIRDELGTIWDGYAENARQMLLNVPEGQPFAVIFPVATDAFTIYNGASSRVGKVDDAQLRKLIVTVYARAKGLIYSFTLNNGLVIDYGNFETMYLGDDKQVRLQHKFDVLARYAIQLKERDAEVAHHLQAFFVRADTWLESH